ncbi:hypothetical protein Tco_0777546, partial [Tanacetum coccineum]
NPLEPAPSLPHIPIDHHQLIASGAVVLDMIKSFSRGTSCRRDSFRTQHLMDCLSGAAVAISDELVSSITQVMNLFLDGKCPKMLGKYITSAPLTSLVKLGVFGVGVSGGVEAILHVVNWLIEDRGDDMGLSMLLVVPGCAQGLVCLDDGTIIGDTLVVGEVLKVITEDGPCRGLHLNVDKTEVFLPKEDPRSRFAGVFPPNIVRPLHDVKLLGAPASADIDFSSELVMKRVAKSIELMDVVAKINDPQCELLLLRACAGISKLYFSMHTCSPLIFKRAQHSFDATLRFDLECIVTASGPGFSDWQWRLSTLPFAFGGFGVYSASDVLNYAFLASRL